MQIEEKYEYNGWPSLPRPDLTPPDGWSLSLLAAFARIHHHSLSPDGKRIAFVWDRDDHSDIYVMNVMNSGWPLRITSERGALAWWDDEAPQWSSDGQWLAFAMNGHVYVIQLSPSNLTSLKCSQPKRVSDFAPNGSNPVWMPGRHDLIITVERNGCQQLVMTNCTGDWPRSIHALSGGDAWDAQPSPDRQYIVFVWRPFNDLHRQEIRRISLESGEMLPLAGLSGFRHWSPRWSPDGNRIAFLCERTGFAEVWLIDSRGDNGAQPCCLTHAEADISDVAWSPDGTRIACVADRGGAFHLVLIDANNGEMSEVRTGYGCYSNPNWSPNSDFLTVEYESPRQPPDLYRVRLDGRMDALTRSYLPAIDPDLLIEPTIIDYPSYDGLEIPSYLYKPNTPNGAAIVYPHGGPADQYTYCWDPFAQYFLAKGYTWLAPNYRGSTGYGRDFEHQNYYQEKTQENAVEGEGNGEGNRKPQNNGWGTGDIQDCLYAARYLKTLDWIEPTRLAIYGGSYGGYLSIGSLARDPDYLYACGISKYGDANLITSWAQCNRHLRLYSELFLGHPAQNRQAYRDGSPIYQVENVQKPMLILHGLLDTVVPPQASEEWVQALRRTGKTFEYKTYASEPHGFLKRATQLDVYSRIERFLDWHLLVK